MADAVLEPVDFYTFWNARSTSRIDRFYVRTPRTMAVQQVQVQLTVFHSDHQQLILHVVVGGTVEGIQETKHSQFTISSALQRQREHTTSC